MKPSIEYQVFALTSYQTDVLTFNNEEDARKAAKEWKEENKNIEIVIEKITKEVIDVI